MRFLHAAWLASQPAALRNNLIAGLSSEQARALLQAWPFWARPEQLPPDGDWRVWLLLAGRGFGKLLHVETPLPTPDGWTAMGNLRVGDVVFDEAGRPCNVMWASDTQREQTFRLRFSDRAELIAGASHQWVTWTHYERKAYLRSAHEAGTGAFPENWPAWRCRRLPTVWLDEETVERALALYRTGMSIRAVERELGISRAALARPLTADRFVMRSPVVRSNAIGPQIRTTDQIQATLRYGKRGDLNHCIPLAGALQLPTAELPVDPYVLGVWLGDGATNSAEITTADPEILEMIEAAGYRLGASRGGGGKSRTWPIGGAAALRDPSSGRFLSNASLRSALRTIGVLEAKKIPPSYLRSSISQRVALLQGLMDSDGYADARNGGCEFTAINRSLADGVMELATSLGLKPTLSVGRATLAGKDCGEKYRVHFTSYFPVFRLRRKAERQKPLGGQALRQRHRMIVAVDEIDPVPMRCISVNSPNHMYLAGRAMIPTHNTRTGAELVRAKVKSGAARRVALVGATAADVRNVMVEGESGLLNIADPAHRPRWEPSKRRLTWPNGAIATTYSAEEPERLRGPQHDFAWCDEVAAWRYPDDAWAMLMFGLRLGSDPRVVVTTTPKPTRLIRELLADPTVAVTRGTTYDNRANLPPAFLRQIIRRYEGTRLGRQELLAELLEDVPGALWVRDVIERGRIRRDMHPDLTRIVAAIDPAATSGEDSDETGIIVAGKDGDGHGWVLADLSGRYAPTDWARRAIAAYHEHHADRIVAEINQGGDMVEATVRAVDPSVPFTTVRASRGKTVRAEPIAALYEQGRVHHVGAFPQLEDQMCAFTTDFDRSKAGYSPDRVDALVWALSELLVEPIASEGIFELYRQWAREAEDRRQMNRPPGQ